MRLIEVAAGVLDAYAAATADEHEDEQAARSAEEDEGALEDRPPDASESKTIAIWRADLDPAYRQLDPDENLALFEAMAGQSFGDICQLVAFQNESQSATEHLARFLVTWFSEGLVIGVAEAK